MLVENQRLVQLGERLRQAWPQPHPRFASGMDPRSSDNALLLQFYGSLAKAAGFGWQNAGRTLVDKTYLRILKECLDLDFQGLSVDELASRLDGFIRQALVPRWGQITASRGADNLPLAAELLEGCSVALFDSVQVHSATRSLLFYLCPQLPLLPYPGEPDASNEAQLQCHQASLLRLPVLPRPTQYAGDAHQQALIRQLIEGCDWWRRRVLAAWLVAAAPLPCATER